MADFKTVYVPDRSQPFSLPASLTNEELRQTLSGMGYASVENANITEESGGRVIRFSRPVGGSKGVAA